MKKIIRKQCKKNKCPYYDKMTDKCCSCEWNPNAVWTVRK